MHSGDYLEALTEKNLMIYRKRGFQTDKVIWEFKGVTFKLDEDKLSQADKLNGIEWKGWAVFSPTSWREKPKSWQDWNKIKSIGANILIRKIKGHWYYDGLSDLSDDPKSRGISPEELAPYEKPSCAVKE